MLILLKQIEYLTLYQQLSQNRFQVLTWNSLEYLSSQRKQAVKARSVIVIGDTVIKHVDKKTFLNNMCSNFYNPGKRQAAEAVDSITVATDSSNVIIHTGPNNLPTDST